MSEGRLQIEESRISAASDGDPRAIADAAVAAWEEIDTRLAPVLGRRGVASLYKRSVHLTLASRPWLAPAYRGAAPAEDLAALHAALDAQDGAAAAAASGELLANFRALLSSLLGEALSSRLLAPQQPSPPDGDVAKEPLQ